MAVATTRGNPAAALGGPRYRIGHTGLVHLEAGDRPFIAVEWNDGLKEYGGWLYVNPFTDAEDPFLRVRGLTPEARRRPCYCMVAAELIRWPK